MNNKQNETFDKFIDIFIKSYDGVQWKDGMPPLDEMKVETEAKINQFFLDNPNSPNVIPYLSLNINYLQKELAKLDTKIDKELGKLDIKIDKIKDNITSEFRWLVGILFILFLALAGWFFYINK